MAMSDAIEQIREARPRRFRPYPQYEDSGVEWLGEMPAHWGLKRLKAVATVQLSNVDKKSEEGQELVSLCNYVDVYYNETITSDLEFMRATATPAQVRRFSLREGDVLITKDSESWRDIAVPAVVVEDLPEVLCGYHLAHIRPEPQLLGTFLARFFSAIGPRDQFSIAANGITRFGLGGEAIRAGLLPVPPVAEQRAIAAFLDRETAKIDNLVASKERLIELLQEKRTALITRAVTRGLDPNAPMKASGVGWLGTIPVDWDVLPLKRILRRWDYGVSESLTGDGEIRVLTMGDVQDGKLHIPADGHLDNVDDALILECGDLLFNRTNSRELVGKVGLFEGSRDDRITFASYLVRMAPGDGVHPSWLNYLLNSSGTLALARRMALLSVNQANLNPTRYTQIDVPVPPSSQQHAIAAFLDRETARIDALIAKIHEAIDHLKEFRAALISAAATGKIDVREEAP